MKIKTLLTYMFIIVLPIIDGCKKNDNPVDNGSAAQATVLMPLKIGNQWTYRSISYDTSGNILRMDTATFKIIRDTIIQNEKWYFIDDFELLTNRSDGLWYMSFAVNVLGGTIPPQAAVLQAKYPANVNDTWLYLDNYLDSTTVKLLAKDVNVNVPKGTYACYQYSKITQFVLSTRYYSVRVGFVKEEFYSKTNSGRSYINESRELLGLSLNKLSLESSIVKRNSSIKSLFFVQK